MNRRLLQGALVVPLALLTACGSSDKNSGGTKDTGVGKGKDFVIGLAIARSGTASSFDEAPAQGLRLRVNQINADGGIAGHKIKIIDGDTQSDPGRASSVASDLVERGADLLAVTCDFDFGSPSAIAAASQNVPSISLCASDPKFADKKTIGPFAFTMGTGTDAKASIAAEYGYTDRGWHTAYVLQDTSIEYTKSLGKYFQARWKRLGGTILGQDTFNGLESAEVRPQVTKLLNLKTKPDLIYLPAFIPPAATVIKEIRDAGITTPIMSAASLDNPLLPKVVNKSSGVFSVAYGCLSYCEGDHDSEITKFDEDFRGTYGSAAVTAYTLDGYELISLVAEALKKNPDARGLDLVHALEAVPSGKGVMQGVAFSSTCHKPTGRAMSILELVNGKFIERARKQVVEIPDVGDGNPCAGGG